MNDYSERLLAIFVAEHGEHVARMRALLGPVETEARQFSPAALDELLRRAHTLKGAARAVGISEIEALGHRMESLFASAHKTGGELDQAAISAIHGALDSSEDALSAVLAKGGPADITPAREELETAAPGAPLERLDTVRIGAENLDRVLRSSTQLLAEAFGQSRFSEEVRELYRGAVAIEAAWDRIREVSSALHTRAERPGLARLSRELASLEKQVRSIANSARSVHLRHQRGTWALAQLAEQLEQEVCQVRMVPAETVFEGFRKMVRDLAREQGKAVEFHQEGLEVQADRMVLQRLKDPVMHLLRNAVFHGLETSAERLAAGKPAAGRVTLRVQARSGRLELAVEDDGRGIDFRAVAEAAVARGLLAKSEAVSIPPDRLLRFLLQPGFSTAKAVTRLSGRGMGLSVAKEAVRRLQGEMSFRTAAGEGTTALLTAPLSISTHRVILVECGRQVFAIPLRGIERICRVKVSDIGSVQGKETIHYDGHVLPLIALAQLLEFPEIEDTRQPLRTVAALVLKSGQQRLAVAVDELLDERTTIVNELGLAPEQAGKASGGVLLEDGRVAIVLNAPDLLRAFDQSGETSRFRRATENRPEQRTILVVDDSITTRSLEKSILEAHGYRVRVAVDGVDALEQLRLQHADLVIADIAMPRLDGFGLLEAMKRERPLQDIPVIVVSSLERQEDQERGLALGADAYLVKRKFDQRELLDAVRQIV